MSAWRWGASFWALPLAGLAGITWAALAPIGVVVERAPADRRAPLPVVTVYAAESLAAALVARDLFRAARRAAPVMFDPMRQAQPVTDVPPKPVLALVGIVSGSEPTALVEGFPGIEGTRVVRVGDVVAGLRIRSISSMAVRILGMDTVWTLTVREPWRN